LYSTLPFRRGSVPFRGMPRRPAAGCGRAPIGGARRLRYHASMLAHRRSSFALAVAVLVLLGFALTARVPAHKQGFFSDEATYHMMAYSLAYDGDLRYEREDLSRVYELGYDAGPSGIFLKRDPDSGRIYYSKAFAYSLAAAPFVRVFDDNGFLVLHALLFALVLAAAYAYLRRAVSDATAATYALTYFLASVALVYFFWITPEWFNLSVVFIATFLWLYKEAPPGWTEGAPVLRMRWLEGGWTDLAAAVLFGVAAFSKPPNVIIAGFFFLWLLYRRRWPRLVAGLVACALVIGGFFAITSANTGDWNYMGGDRKTFNAVSGYPFSTPTSTFDSVGVEMVTNLEDYKDRIPVPRSLASDLVYVWVGRNAGMLVYMFPAIMALLMFAGTPKRSWRGPHAFVLAAWATSILAYVLVIPDNWIGGGGTIGSRYFVSAYPLMFFLIPAGVGVLGAVGSWVIAALFLAQIMLNPYASSQDPSMHTKGFPFRMLPPELSLLNNLPFNTHPGARRVALNLEEDVFVYFLDDNTHGREPDTWGFWTVMGRDAEFVIRTQAPAAAITLVIRNGPVDNRVIARLEGESFRAEMSRGEQVRLRFEPGRGFPYGNTRLYRFALDSDSGFVPKFTPASQSSDFRALGVFVEVDVEYAGAGAGGTARR